jgi:putative membrane protein
MQPQRTPGIVTSIIRTLVIWAIEVIGLLALGGLLPGLLVGGLPTAVAVAVIGLLNGLLWPLLSHVPLRFGVLTLGIFSLVMNSVMVWLAGNLVPGFMVADIRAGIAVALGLSAITVILSSLLTIDDDQPYYRNVVRRRLKGRATPAESESPGVLFLEIDGLARPVLERAIRAGRMPTLARWLKRESHHLVSWECDLSSQTSASQAGILHGNNFDIPAYRWYDRASRQIVSSSSPAMLAQLEKRHSDGNGLLVRDGISRGNMFSGDARLVMYTISTITDVSRLYPEGFYGYFGNPYNVARTLLLFVWEVLLEIYQFARARWRQVQPRLGPDKRGGLYPLMRAVMTVLVRELNTYTLIGDMLAGAPAAYATFPGYDEVAHYSGVESDDALGVLHKLDRQFARLASAAEMAPRPYHLVVLSDHGQSGGATFKQRYDTTLEALVQALATGQHRVQGSVGTTESWSRLNALLTDIIHNEATALARPLRRLLQSRTHDGHVILGPESDLLRNAGRTLDGEAEVIVLGTGNLGLIYFTARTERMSLEEINQAFPQLVTRLAQHPGIGFVMAHSEEHGPVVIGARGVNYVVEGRVEGQNPLTRYGANAAAHLHRTDSFPAAPDILVNSFYNPDTNEVAAFEELIGCHGGLGGYQAQPFMLLPTVWQTGEEAIVGAETVYHRLKGWLDRVQRYTASASMT